MNISITNGTLTKISETLAPVTGYTLPTSITVTPNTVTKSYNPNTGVVELTDLTSGDTVTLTATGAPEADRRINLLTTAPFNTYPAGTYTLKVKAIGDGYRDSATQTVTWVKQ